MQLVVSLYLFLKVGLNVDINCVLDLHYLFATFLCLLSLLPLLVLHHLLFGLHVNIVFTLVLPDHLDLLHLDLHLLPLLL